MRKFLSIERCSKNRLFFIPFKEGVTSEIMAIAQGEMDTATLLNQSSTQRDTCVKQLMPGRETLSRVKVKVSVYFVIGQGQKTGKDQSRWHTDPTDASYEGF